MTASDREALIALLAGYGVWLDRAQDVADAILTSSWLADRDRTVQAEMLRTVADQLDSISPVPELRSDLYRAAANLEGMTTR